MRAAMITVTPKAVGKIRETLDKNQITGGLRLGVVGGGCSGFSYKFKLENEPRASDNVFEFDGVKLCGQNYRWGSENTVSCWHAGSTVQERFRR